MAPKGVSNWRRPYTSIYNDNYRYGNSLYSDTLSDIEKRYSDSLSRTQLRSDRPDLAFTTFIGSSLTSSPTPGVGVETPSQARPTSLSPIAESFRDSTFASRLNSAFHSSYAEDEAVDKSLSGQQHQSDNVTLRRQKSVKASDSAENSPRPKSLYDKSLYDDAVFWSLPKPTPTPVVDFDTDSSKRRKAGRETTSTTTNGPSSGAWREKSRDLQNQVDQLEKSMSDTSSRLRSELSTLKSKCHSELSTLNSSVDLSSQQANELQRTVKKQANQLAELQSAYDDSQRNLLNTLEEMDTWQNRCKSLKKEMDRLREEVEQAMQKSSSKV